MATLALEIPKNRASSGAIARSIMLYLTLLAYGWVYLYLYGAFTSVQFRAYQLYYDESRWTDYIWTIALTPLAVLPAGTVIRTASHFILPVLVVILFIPMNIIFLASVSPATYWTTYLYSSLGILLLSLASRSTYGIGELRFSRVLSHNIVVLSCLFFALAFIAALRNGFSITAMSDIYVLRENLRTDALSDYAGNIYIHSLGGFFLAMALRAGNRFLAILAVVGFILCYGLFYLKVALLAPFWLAYMYLANRYFVRESVIRLYLVIMAPLGLSLCLYLADPTMRTLPAIAYHWLVTLRLYTIPPSMLSIYYNFFQTHPYTYWAHITGLNIFLHNPYSQDMSVVMADKYGLGTLPGFFLAADGIEAAGIEAIPFISGIVALTFVLINTSARGLDRMFVAVCMAMPAHQLVDRPFATSLLSGGLLFLVVLLFLAPKNQSSASTEPGLHP